MSVDLSSSRLSPHRALSPRPKQLLPEQVLGYSSRSMLKKSWY